jgi:TonB family protein
MWSLQRRGPTVPKNDTVNAAPIHAARTLAQRVADEVLALSLGAGFTLALFIAMAHFENAGEPAQQAQIEDLRVVAAVAEPPPPKPEETTEPVDVVTPLMGIEIAASDSPLKIAVVPPDLTKIIASTEVPPRAAIQPAQLYTDLRPKADLSGEFERIFQQNEVDQVPMAVVKTIAKVSRRVRDDADQLRVTLAIIIDSTGAVTSIRVLRPSGNVEFDSIVVDCVRNEWAFSPAIRKGKRVRCMVQQLVWYKWTEGSPFAI